MRRFKPENNQSKFANEPEEVRLNRAARYLVKWVSVNGLTEWKKSKKPAIVRQYGFDYVDKLVEEMKRVEKFERAKR